MSKEKSGDSNEKISANDPDYVNPFTGERPNRKSPSPDIDHLTVKQMQSIFDENNIKYKKSGNKGQLKDVLTSKGLPTSGNKSTLIKRILKQSTGK